MAASSWGAPSGYGAPPGGYGAPGYGAPPGPGGPQASLWGGMWSGGGQEKVTITASARDLPKMDGLMGKCDGYIQVSLPAAGVLAGHYQPGKHSLIFKSEVVKQNLNPSWQPFSISLTEAGGEHNQLLWELFDWDSDGTHDFIGSFMASLAQIQAPSASFPIQNPNRKSTFGKAKSSGTFHITSARKAAAEAKPVPRAIRFIFRGESLAKKDIRTSDPFLIFRAVPLASASGLPGHHVPPPAAHDKKKAAKPRPVVIATTEVIPKNLNPTWQPIELELELTGGLLAPIHVSCFDFDSDGTHDLIGEATTNLKDLLSTDPMIPLIEPEKVGKMGYRNSGILRVTSKTEIPVGAPIPKPEAFRFDVSARKLARMDGVFGKADPFIQITLYGSKKNKAPAIYKSDHIQQTLEPKWAPFVLSVVNCSGMDNPLHFEVWDQDSRGAQLIGSFQTSLRELVTSKIKDHHLRNKKHMSRYSGIVNIASATPCAAPAAAPGAHPPGHGGYGAPPGAPGYGAPPGAYGGAPGYGAPPGGAPGYGPPPGAPGAYGAPPGAYGAPPGSPGLAASGGYGAPPPGAYGAPPGGYGAPPGAPGGYGAPPGSPGLAASGGYGAPPGAPGYGAPPPGAYGAPPGGLAASGGYGAPPGAPGGYGAPPGSPGLAASGGYGAPPGAPGYGAPPGGAPGYGAPPGAPGGYGAPPGAPGAYGAPPGSPGLAASGGYGAPPPGGYYPPPADGGYGAPPGSYYPPPSGAPPGGAPGGAAPPGY